MLKSVLLPISLAFILLLVLSLGKKTPNQKLLPPPFKFNNHNEVIDKINSNNKKIQTFSAYLDVTSKKVLNLKGQLLYEKPKNFYLEMTSLLGQELLIGSNTQYFWFWSKRMHPSVLHYADYKDIFFTRLKTPFNPIWMMQSLGLDEIPNGSIIYDKDLMYVRIECLSATGIPIIRFIEIDVNKPAIIGNYVIEDGKIVASTQILEHYYIDGCFVPKTMHLQLDGKNYIDWQLNDVKVNPSLNKNYFVLPHTQDMLNMAVD